MVQPEESIISKGKQSESIINFINFKDCGYQSRIPKDDRQKICQCLVGS